MYEFMPGKATIVTEIYLPAQYAISPSFLQALDDSLLPKQVQKHFDNNLEETIKKLLPETLRERYSDLEGAINKSGRSFGGYSIYDLKGAWKATAEKIERDANACVRIIDWPTPEMFSGREWPLCERVIRTVFALGQYRDAYPQIASILQIKEGVVDEICKALDKWIDEGSFLLYGFVMYHLSQITKGYESEILLTSHFAVVNQIVRQDNHQNAGSG